MVDSNKVLALIKFGKAHHLQRFLSEGLVYMNTVAYFATLETDHVRHDQNEGVAYLLRHEGVKIGVKRNLGDRYVSLGELAAPVLFRSDTMAETNVFCMYGLRRSALEARIDERNLAFGDSFVIIRDGDEFLRRARKAAEAIGRVMKCRAVEYVDEKSFGGPLGIFRKYSSFAYQSEVRLALVPGTGAPYELRLGSLEDIVAPVGACAELDRYVRGLHFPYTGQNY